MLLLNLEHPSLEPSHLLLQMLDLLEVFEFCLVASFDPDLQQALFEAVPGPGYFLLDPGVQLLQDAFAL